MHPPAAHPRRTDSGDASGNWNAIHWMVLGFIVLTALWLRVDDLVAWRNQPERAFFNGRPLLITFDGYYYLSLARDLQEHSYSPVDTLRGIPDPPSRPTPPPMISVLAAVVSSLFSISLDWVGVLLPPLLGVGLAVPLYLFGRLYGGRMMALVAVGTGLYASYYLYRSNLGWFDTDCLNVTLAFGITYLFLRFGREAALRRYLYLAAGIVGYLLFLWWWDQAAQAVTLIAVAPLAIVITLEYRPAGRERRLALGIAAVLLVALLIWQGSDSLVSAFRKITGTLGYLAKQQIGDFPNTGVSIFEQKRLAPADVVAKTMGNYPAFLAGLAGIGWLIWKKRRMAAPLGILFLLGCFSFLFARRFLIFLNPFLAIGIGFMVQKLWDLRRQWPPGRYVAPTLALLACMTAAAGSIGKVYWPKEIPPIVAGMDYLARESQPDAVAWAWWDHGYSMLYWGRRATINDGSVHDGLRTVCNALPLAMQDQRTAANFMHFYVARGTRGMQRLFQAAGGARRGMQLMQAVMEAGPEGAAAIIARAALPPEERWDTFFFPPVLRDVYLFLDLRLARTTYWWYWFGTWRPERKDGRHASFRLIRDVRLRGDGIEGPDLTADLAAGKITYRNRTFSLSQALVRDGSRRRRIAFPEAKGLVLAVDGDARVAALMEPAMAESVFGRLYTATDADPHYFRLVAEQYPYYQIWRVMPERK